MQTWEAKALVQRHSVHFYFFSWALLRPDGTQNQQNVGVKGPYSAEMVQVIIGLLKERQKGRFFKEKPGNSLGRIHRSVTHVTPGVLFLWAIAILSSVNTITVV